MRALLLNAEVCRAIDAAVDAARANPIPWETFKQAMGNIDQDTDTIPLKDRPPDFKRPPSQHVLIPMGFRASFSFEEQPAGLVRHLSISVEDGLPGALPNVPSIIAIAAAFGFSMSKGMESFDRAWTEEYAPEKWAINVLQLDHEREAPTETRQ